MDGTKENFSRTSNIMGPAGGGQSPGQSPTVNYINITRRPEGGIVNVEMKRHQGLNRAAYGGVSAGGVVHKSADVPPLGGGGGAPPFPTLLQQSQFGGQMSRSNEATTPNMSASSLAAANLLSYINASTGGGLIASQQQLRPGSTYSSPRSSIGSGGGYESKGSSPRTSIVVSNPPPLPVHYDRHGSPHNAVQISPRSSISSVSIESSSKHSSPRTSIVGAPTSLTMYDTKYPMVRGVIIQQPGGSGQRSHTIVSMSGLGGANHEGGSGRSHVFSLFDRFNEPAPPPYDTRMRTQATGVRLSNISVVPQTIAAFTPSANRPGRRSEVRNIPIKIVDGESQRPPMIVYNIPVNLADRKSVV